MKCPRCHGLYAATRIERRQRQRIVRCPLCGPQPFRATFNNPPLIIDQPIQPRPKRRR